MAASWPLTGRAEELCLISGLIRHRDGPAGVVLAGAAGVGKTRLVREALAAAQQRGALTRWAATLVLTLRTGESTPDAVTALWKDGHLTRLELQPLSQEVYRDGRRLEVRLAHPLYGEVQRAQIGTLHARRLRGRIGGRWPRAAAAERVTPCAAHC